MPIGLGAATLIAGGIGAAAQGGQVYAQGKMNKKTRAWNEKMYERQKIDNQTYNSPAAQMQRMKDAGLNPHLIYGNMQTASPVAPATAPKWDPETPNIAGIGNSIANTISAYQSSQQAQTGMDIGAQQLENMKTANQLQMLDGVLKLLQIDKNTFVNSKQDELHNYAIDMVKAKLSNMDSATMKLDVDRHIALAENDRKDEYLKIAQDNNIRSQKQLNLKIEEMALKQANSEVQRAQIKAATKLLENDIRWDQQEWKDFENGLNKSSTAIERMIGEYAGREGMAGFSALQTVIDLLLQAKGRKTTTETIGGNDRGQYYERTTRTR